MKAALAIVGLLSAAWLTRHLAHRIARLWDRR